jgi:hypothetical protein
MMFIMTVKVNITAAEVPDDELVRKIKEVIVRLLEPLATEKPYISVTPVTVEFPDIKDEAEKNKGAERIIPVMNAALSSVKDVTLFDYDFVWPTLMKSGIASKSAHIPENERADIIKELQADWIILASIKDGEFSIHVIPTDRYELTDRDELTDGDDFDPGGTFYAELCDGWRAGPRPSPSNWTAPGKITGLAFVPGGKLAVAGNSSEGAWITVLEAKMRIPLNKKTTQGKVNDLFWDVEGKNLIAALEDRIEIYTPSLELIRAIPIADDEPRSVVSEGSKILVTGKNGFVGVYDFQGTPLTLPQKFNTQGNETLASVSADGAMFGIVAGNTAWTFPATLRQTKSTIINGEARFNSVTFNTDNVLRPGTENGAVYSEHGIFLVTANKDVRMFTRNNRLMYKLLAEKNGEEFSGIAYSAELGATAVARGETLSIFDIKEPTGILTVKNNSLYSATVAVDGEPVDIPPNESYTAHLVMETEKVVPISLLGDDQLDALSLAAGYSRKETIVSVTPGNTIETYILDNTRRKAVLSDEVPLEITALAATKDFVVAAFPTLAHGKTSIASAEVAFLKLTNATVAFLKPHFGAVIGIITTNKNIYTVGLDKIVNRYDNRGQYLSSITLDGVPIGVEKNDNALLIIFEDGVSLLNFGSNATETLHKAQSVSWNGETVSTALWKAAPRPPVNIKLGNTRSIAAVNNTVIFFEAGKPVAQFALYPNLEWLLTANGYFTGSRLANKKLRITEGPKVSRPWQSDSDEWLMSPNNVAAVLRTYSGGVK